MLGSLEDTLLCKNTSSTLRVIGLFTLFSGLTILMLGIIDVTHYATCYQNSTAAATNATKTNSTATTNTTTSTNTTTKAMNNTQPTFSYVDFELTQVAVGIWGSLPIIFAGLLAMYGSTHPEYSLKFLGLLSAAAGFLFAPAVLVISSIDASKQVYLACTQINNVSVSIALAVFGGLATFFLQIINYHLFCSNFDEDEGQEELVNQPVQPRKSFRLFAEKDQFMKSSIPEEPTLDNGAEVTKPSSLAQPTHHIFVPIGLMRAPVPQPQYLGGGGMMMGGRVKGGMISGGRMAPGGIYPMLPPQPQFVQQQAVAPQGGMVQGAGIGDPPYYINFVGGDRINTNVYPQLYKL